MKTTPSNAASKSRRTASPPSTSAGKATTPAAPPERPALETSPSFAATTRADRDLIENLQRDAFEFFLRNTNPENGLVADSTQDGSPASIAATGFALSCYAVAAERRYLTRREAALRVLAALRFFCDAPQDGARDGVGFHGFFYHFLDMKSGRRAGKCELSSIDSALLFAGALTCAAYFNSDNSEEREIRERAEQLYAAADWNWMQDGAHAVSHGWNPGRGFLKSRWNGYSEALILYVLGLGSPTHALPPESYAAWTRDFRWKTIYGLEYVYAGPLFIHQTSHVWLDLRGLQDDFMRAKGSDYFENSRRATQVQREYSRRNALGFAHYDENCWGITASDGPGQMLMRVNNRARRFYGYKARGAPYGPDDGTISPWVAASSLPFCPELVMPALHRFEELHLGPRESDGLVSAFNATFPQRDGNRFGWTAPHDLGINQGPLVLLLENYRSSFLWDLMRDCKYLETGLRRANFRGGWL